MSAVASYYAEGGFVWKHPVETRGKDGVTRITMGFRVCKMMPEVGPGAAETVAELMNAGHVALMERAP